MLRYNCQDLLSFNHKAANKGEHTVKNGSVSTEDQLRKGPLTETRDSGGCGCKGLGSSGTEPEPSELKASLVYITRPKTFKMFSNDGGKDSREKPGE